MKFFSTLSLFSESLLWIGGSGVLAVVCALGAMLILARRQRGADKMEVAAMTMADHIGTFLRSIVFWMLLSGLAIALLLYLFIDTGWFGVVQGQWQLPLTAGSFLLGVFAMLFAVVCGMRAAGRFAGRTAQAARTSLQQALHLTFLQTAIPAWLGSGIAMLSLCGGLLFFLEGQNIPMSETLYGLLGLALGSSFVSFFLRMSGGLGTELLIFASPKNLQQSEEAPEHAGLSGEIDRSILGIAASSADVLDLFLSAMLAVMLIALSTDFGPAGTEGSLLFPVAFGGVGILSSLPFGFLIRSQKGSDLILDGWRNAIFLQVMILIIGSFLLTHSFFDAADAPAVFIACLTGIFLPICISILAEQTFSGRSGALPHVRASAHRGAVDLYVSGLAFGHLTLILPLFFAGLAVIVAWLGAGIYGIALVALGSAGIPAVTILLQCFGSIAASSGAVVRASELPKQVAARLDVLSDTGSLLSSIGKVTSTFGAFLTLLTLFFVFTDHAALRTVDLGSPVVLFGLLIGILLPVVAGGMGLQAILECREYLRTSFGFPDRPTLKEPGLILRTVAGKAARETFPLLCVLLTVLLTGFFFGIQGLAGMLAGSLLFGTILSLLLFHAGSAWHHPSVDSNLGSSSSAEHLTAASAIARIARELSAPMLLQVAKLTMLTALVTAGLFAGTGVF